MPPETETDQDPEDAGDHEVPVDLVELHEVLEWTNAVEEAEAEA